MSSPEDLRKARMKYRAKFIYLQVRTTDEYRSTIHQHVGKTGESMNAFILRAISETMARDQSKIK